MSKRSEVARIEIVQHINDDGELFVDYETSDGMAYIEMLGLLEMTKLAIHEESLRPTEEE